MIKFIIEDNLDLEELNPVGKLSGDWYTRSKDNFKIIRKIKEIVKILI